MNIMTLHASYILILHFHTHTAASYATLSFYVQAVFPDLCSHVQLALLML